MNHSKIQECLTLVVPFLVCCSNIKEASNENFAAAINRELANDRACLQLSLPAKILVSDGKRRTYHPPEEPLLDAMVAAGVLGAREETLPEEGLRAFGEPKKYPHKVFDLSDKGREAVAEKGQVSSFLGRNRTVICYGVGEVTAVTNFTAPSEVSGVQVSQVQYEYKIGQLADWAKVPAVVAADQRVAAAVRGEPFQGRASLVLTAKGWQTHEEFSRAERSARAAR